MTQYLAQFLPLDLEDYSKLVCVLLDIPIHDTGDKNIVESLHLLFTLYAEFVNNVHLNPKNS